MTSPHAWVFRASLRRRAFGWTGTGKAIAKLDAAVAEIAAIARTDPALAGEGAVLLLEKVSPAVCEIDSSSGALGNATHQLVETLVPIIAAAPVTTSTRQKWLDRLFNAYQEDDPPYIESLGEHWGAVCASPTLASCWADDLLPSVRGGMADRQRGVHAFSKATRPCPYKITLDRGLQLRIAPDGARTLLVRYTVKGSNTERQYRLPQSYGEGPGQLKLAAACAEAARIRALARAGVDWTTAEDERLRSEAATKAALQRDDGLTVAKAVRDHVEKKRRAKDGLPLKARTRSDYLNMVEPARTTEKGTRQAAGALHPIAHKALSELAAGDIREAYVAAAKRSVRRAAYAMQVLRAVLRWHGVDVPDNPLGRETAGRDRITISAPHGDPSPILPEVLGAWWRAACIAPSQVAADYYRFQLLTGCRGIEIHGHKLHGYPPIAVGDVDQRGGRVVLRDTKNRRDHKLLLSTQALEIAKRNCLGRKAEEPLFPIVDARKTLAWINAKAGTNVQGHGLRATFASIAEELVSSALLKRMMNHAAAGDVTLGHYVAKSEAQLRAGWQAVAEFVEEAAKQS